MVSGHTVLGTYKDAKMLLGEPSALLSPPPSGCQAKMNKLEFR